MSFPSVPPIRLKPVLIAWAVFLVLAGLAVLQIHCERSRRPYAEDLESGGHGRRTDSPLGLGGTDDIYIVQDPNDDASMFDGLEEDTVMVWPIYNQLMINRWRGVSTEWSDETSGRGLLVGVSRTPAPPITETPSTTIIMRIATGKKNDISGIYIKYPGREFVYFTDIWFRREWTINHLWHVKPFKRSCLWFSITPKLEKGTELWVRDGTGGR